MRRIHCLLTAAAMTAILPAVPVSASDRDVRVSIEIVPAYIVTIPTDLQVPQDTELTPLGTVRLESARLEPDKCIRVTMQSSRLLRHEKDTAKTLPYVVCGEDATEFTGATYRAAGDHTDLTVAIRQDDWVSAYAGTYSDTITFVIEYTDQAQ